MHWVLLAVAIVLEVAGTTNMKLSEGFTRPLPSVCPSSYNLEQSTA